MNLTRFRRSYIKSMNWFLDTLIIGIALSVAWYWLILLASLFVKVDMMNRWSWWILVMVPQGVFLAWALRLIKILP
jgi:hypothetical protein